MERSVQMARLWREVFRAIERSVQGYGEKCLRLWIEVFKAVERSVEGY